MAFPEIRYDRTVTEKFLSRFLPGGVAASLLQYAQGQFPIDFQLRKNPKTGAQWATLYVGMTSVLDVVEHKGGLKLRAHPKYARADHGWQPGWGTPAPANEWQEEWVAVEDYLEQVIPFVMLDGRYTKTEGLVQAAVASYKADPTLAVLDREVGPHFRDDPTKKRIQTMCSDPLAEALRTSKPVPGKPRTPFGMKCDALAIDTHGRLVVIEIKPGNVGSLAWVAAQATMYAKVLQHWVDRDPDWQQIMQRSFDQRARLGLVPQGFELPELRPEVVPAVAFQRRAKPVYRERMFAVQKALVAAGAGDPRLTFHTASLSGRLDQVDA